MSITCTNMKAFTRGLRAAASVSKKSGAEIVNKAAKDVGFRAMQFTPKTTPAAIESSLKSRGQMLDRMAAKNLRGRGGLSKSQLASAKAKATKGKRGGSYRRSWTEAIKKEKKRILRQRRARAAAFRAGWIPAIRQMGGTIRGDLKGRGSAAKGFGKKATSYRPAASIRNAVISVSHSGKKTGAGRIKITVDALNKAAAYVGADRENYARQKLIAKAARAAIKNG